MYSLVMQGSCCIMHAGLRSRRGLTIACNCLAHFAEQCIRDQIQCAQPAAHKEPVINKHALSACTCMCLGTKPHLLQAGVRCHGQPRVPAHRHHWMSACAHTCHATSCCMMHAGLRPRHWLNITSSCLGCFAEHSYQRTENMCIAGSTLSR